MLMLLRLYEHKHIRDQFCFLFFFATAVELSCFGAEKLAAFRINLSFKYYSIGSAAASK